MAADYQRMIRNLLEFLDFSSRAVITVGTGGGQFIEYGRSALKVLAVDQDGAALEVLRERLAQAGLADKFTLVHAEFLKFRESEAYCQERGISDWSYAGDSRVDLAVWRHAARIYVTAPSAGLLAP